MPAFAQCDRRQIWRIARWGEVIECNPGEVLVREDHTDYWFFVLLAGSVQLTHRNKTVATLHPGDHFGELAIVGFRPQAATATAVEPCMLFVLGRRYLLSLAALDVSVRRALFPQAEGKNYGEFIRDLHAEGRRDWDRLKPRYRTGRSFSATSVPGRALTWGEALDVLSHQTPATRTQTVVQPPKRRRSLLLPVAIAVVVAALVATLYHPPVAVITPGRPVDVVQDISITGTRVHEPTGRYLLTPVNVDRPNLAGLAVARILGRLVVRTRVPDAATAGRLAHDVFINSHRQAIALAEKTLRVHGDGITIAIRDRGFVGPSAGLVYALAIVDMLDTGDVSAHRVIAATGELMPDGNVGPVGFVSLKAEAALEGGAVVFLVPRAEVLDARAVGLAVIGVSSLKEAVRSLERHR